jgi:PAS domain S-box-containing protein
MNDHGDRVGCEHGHAHFLAVAETAQDAIITIDATGCVRYANPRAVDMFAAGTGALVGSQVTELIPERLREAHRAGLARYVETGESRLVGRTVVVPARRGDGSEFPVELSLASWQTDDRPMFTAIVRDVSERELLLGELEQALVQERQVVRELSELNDLKDTLMDTVSHDIRSPLGAIRALVEVLERDVDSASLSSTQRRDVVESLKRSADRIHQLLEDLLALEQMSAGAVSLDLRRTDLAELARKVVLDNDEALRGRDVTLRGGPMLVEVDPPKVERVLENLLLNAVRHTPPGSAVEVSVGGHEGWAEICVADSGPGIPEELRDQVFERFFRVPGGRGGGSGLGLSLVARLAALHGGRAWIEDSHLGGASVRVRLPSAAGTGGAVDV